MHCPTSLSIRKKPFTEFESGEMKVFWKETIVNTEIQRKIYWKRYALEYVKECSALKKGFGMSYIN